MWRRLITDHLKQQTYKNLVLPADLKILGHIKSMEVLCLLYLPNISIGYPVLVWRLYYILKLINSIRKIANVNVVFKIIFIQSSQYIRLIIISNRFLFDLQFKILAKFRMVIAKNVLVFLTFAISVSSIFAQVGIKTAPQSIYPNLTEFRNSSNTIIYNINGNITHFYDVIQYPQFNSTKEKFINSTLSHIMTSGVCVKEVP